MKAKALFLLVTFLLTYVVGLACALQEIKSSHQEEHSHSNHSHSSEHSHSAEHSHPPEAAQKKSLETTDSSQEEESGCCTDELAKFESLNKNTNQISKIETKASVVTILLNNFLSLVLFAESKGFSKYIANRQRPPNTDTRILIQSFQI